MLNKQIAVYNTSRCGSSLIKILTKEIEQKLNVSESDYIGFYEVTWKISDRKIKFGILKDIQ
jgi:hypothetical protein